MNTNSKENLSKTDDMIDKLADQISTLVDIFAKKVLTPAPVKAVEESCVTCGGAHAYYNCPNTDSNQPSVCVATGTYNQIVPQNRASNFVAPPGFAPAQNSQNRYNQRHGNNFNRGNNFHCNQPFQVPNQGFQNQSFQVPNNPVQQVERETEETTDKEQTNFQGSTAHIQPLVTLISEPDVPKTLPNPNIPYPSRLNDQKIHEKATNQMEKFFQIFQDLHFDISFADALLLMPKFASTIKSLLTNKDKLFELAKIPLNENCSAMLLKKLPEKLGDPGKFLIPCDFPRMDVCHALADLSASINLMPLSIWKKLSLPELTPTRMTLELANQSITRPKGVVEDVFVKVGKFHFPIDFVVVDFEAGPCVPLILGRSFLRTGHSLIDVYGEEITIRVNDEAVTFNLNQTTRYSSTYDDSLVKRIDIIDVAREKYAQEILGFSNNFSGNNPTLTFEPILFDSSPSLTPFEGSDFILEEIEAYLKDESISLEIDHVDYLKQGEVVKAKSLIEELKDLPSHLEYAYLEGVDKLPVIIAKDLKVDKKETLLRVLKSHKRAIAWKITDIKGIDPRFCTYKILMDEDYKPAVQVKDGLTQKFMRMPFGLCNAPGTFQMCMMAIFYDMIEKTIEVFMDDFLAFGDSFSSCLSYLDTMLQRLEVDRAKVDVIAKLPHPTTVKGVRSFLGHADFYRRFIQGVSKIAKPVTHLLEKETPFVFSKDYIDAFETLKKKLTEASILVIPDWNLPFELIANISGRGTHFCKDKFAKVMSKYGVTHRLATAYHPQTSGQVEVSNRGLKRILERTVGENQHEAYWALKHVNFDLKTARDHRKLQLNELRDQAYDNSLIYKEKTKKLHDSKIKNRIYNIGDRVLLFNSHLKILLGKLKTRWSGPFTITKVFPYGTVELSQPDGPNFKVNGHRVKHYFGGDVPQLVVPDLQTFPMDK
nr:reverse transcriptase domain-containing protein [Tanacetum cinerariifolium]